MLYMMYRRFLLQPESRHWDLWNTLLATSSLYVYRPDNDFWQRRFGEWAGYGAIAFDFFVEYIP